MTTLDPLFMNSLRPVFQPNLVRLGSSNDGGYLISESALQVSDFLISLGYGKNSDFEESFLNLSRSNRLVCFDSSINLRSMISSLLASLPIVGKDKNSYLPYRSRQLYEYLKFRLNPRVSYKNLKVYGDSVPDSKKAISFSQVLNMIRDFKRTIIKMDIEGAEYPCLLSALSSSDLIHLNAMVVEFHAISDNLEAFERIIGHFLKTFDIVHIHINNYGEIINGIPQVLEISFINRKLNSFEKLHIDQIPHGLDEPCNPRVADLIFTFDQQEQTL